VTPAPFPTIGNCRLRTGGAVEAAVAQGDPARVRDRLVEMTHGGVGLPRRSGRSRVERILLGLDRPALARVAVAGETLGDEPAHACLTGGGQQRIGALGPEPVGGRETTVEAPGEAHIRQGRRLVDDRPGLGVQDGRAHGARVEQVERDRLGPERPDPLRVPGRPEAADHLVSLIDELGNEPGADRTARSHDEDPHRVPPCVRAPGHIRRLPGSQVMTPGDAGM
jgi:hypothetical protein